MSENKKCCFTAHRPSKFSFKYNENHPDCIRIKKELAEKIEAAILAGYNYFIAGGALGGDTWAAEAVIELKKKYPNIKLEIAIPCNNQDKMWPSTSQKRYRDILAKADVVHYISKEKYNPSLMLIRDVCMVNDSTLIISIFDGSKGGTFHTFDYAKKLGINLWRINPKDFSFSTIEAKEKPQSGILECSSIGNPRFSALYAYVEMFGRVNFIEDHYQLCKRFDDEMPKTKWDAKGKVPTHIVLNGKRLKTQFLTPWFKLLWCKYLDIHPELVEYARKFEDFHDTFNGKDTINCQADAIRQYIREGRESIISECSELINILNLQDEFKVEKTDPRINRELGQIRDVIVKYGSFAFLIDKEYGAILKWGDVDFIKKEYDQKRVRLIFNDMEEVADNLIFIELPKNIDIKEIYKFIHCTGYLAKFLKENNIK